MIIYREMDGVSLCMRNPDCLLEADHAGVCVLQPAWMINPELWSREPLEAWDGTVIAR